MADNSHLGPAADVSYFRGRPAFVTPQWSYNGVYRDELKPLFLEHVWTLGKGEIYLSTLELPFSLSVTPDRELVFMFMVRGKSPVSAIIESCHLVVDGAVVEPVDAVWISPSGGGVGFPLRVHDEGDGPFSDATCKAYVRFELPPSSAAVLEVRGRGSRRVMVYRTLETFGPGRTWANTVQNTFQWRDGFDWRTPAGADPEYGYQLARFYFAGPLCDDPGLIRLMTSFISQVGACYPRSLDTADRLRNWLYAYERLRHSPALTPQAHLLIVQAFYDAAAFLDEAVAEIPNWMQAQKASLLYVALYFPEFDLSAVWRSHALEFLTAQLDSMLYPDGGYREATDSYALGVASAFGEVASVCAAYGVPFAGRVDRLTRFLADQVYPDGFLANYGDSEYAPSGLEPSRGPAFYPDTRVAVMRPRDNLYLRINLDRGPHAHADELAINLYGHGRVLLPNMGSFSYSDDPRALWLRFSTSAHNTVTIDGVAQDSSAPGAFTEWDGEFVRGWTDATPGVRHERSVRFVAPATFVVVDVLTPIDDEVHCYEQNWHFLPDALIVAEPLLRTNFASGSNLVISQDDGLVAQIRDGYYSPRFYAIEATKYASFVRRAAGVVRFETTLTIV